MSTRSLISSPYFELGSCFSERMLDVFNKLNSGLMRFGAFVLWMSLI